MKLLASITSIIECAVHETSNKIKFCCVVIFIFFRFHEIDAKNAVIKPSKYKRRKQMTTTSIATDVLPAKTKMMMMCIDQKITLTQICIVRIIHRIRVYYLVCKLLLYSNWFQHRMHFQYTHWNINHNVLLIFILFVVVIFCIKTQTIDIL